MINKFVRFKNPKKYETILYMHPLIVMVMFDMALWCDERNIDFVVTDTISTIKRDKKLGRVSDSHRTRRAFDARSKNFSIQQRIDFINHFNEKYKNIASVSTSDFEPRMVVFHGKGENEHFHIAINKRFSLKGE